MGRQTNILFLTMLLSLFASDAFARSGRENQIPNNQWGCDVCHIPGGTGLNDFGFDSFDYTSGGTVNWAGLSQEDSDRDGYSNGLELADPNGTGGNNGGMITHPGDRNSGLCGDGALEGAEECEAGNLGGATCASMGLTSGNLACTGCRFDTSGCDTCGDNVLQGSEECDGTDLGGNTCESLGRGTGTLSCTGCGYDYSGCSDNTDPTPLTCGDSVRQTEEDCDGSDLGGQTCATMGFTGGVLKCEVRCGFDTSGCIGGSGVSPAPGSATPNPNSTTQSSASSAPLSDDPEQKISLDGHACSTTSGTPAPSGAMLLLIAIGAVLRRR